MPLTLERLQQLLRDEDDDIETNELCLEPTQQSGGIVTGDVPTSQFDRNKIFDEYWQNPPIRPGFSENLYRCPVSSPPTTLVLWSTLPQGQQTQLEHLLGTFAFNESKNDDNAETNRHRVVEIPRIFDSGDAALLSTSLGATETSILQQNYHHQRGRPLVGNLTTKLTEYTRGVAGYTRPFQPGGDALESNHPVDQSLQRQQQQKDIHSMQEAIAKSERVLQQSTLQSWQEGILLTAPPGVNFCVGLSLRHLTGHDAESEVLAPNVEVERNEVNRNNAQEELMLLDSPDTHGSSRGLSALQASSLSRPPMVTGEVFTRTFLEDDSLFGSSSSDDESESDAEADQDISTTLLEPIESSAVVQLKDSGNEPPPIEMDEDQEEDFDGLLRDLTISSNDSLVKAARDRENPLIVAEELARLQFSSNRKLWASTKLLPIKDFSSYIPNPAMVFPFELDGFQQQAIARLERSESVFVAAHTSAGKTVVAEYAVALARQRSTRCIYTSPIKALSNQKFRDFSLKFGSENVGLVTGDLQVNVEESVVLIMTTEILRSMLYRGADLIRDIEFVIFDEVHYVNDTERGVVWEEVIIMLPSYVNLIFLSATTPNTLEFSDWIGRTKRKPVHVVKTDYRPVPLSHHLWAGSKLHKVLQGNGPFLEKGYAEASDALLPSSVKDKSKNDKSKPQRQATGSKQLAWQAQGSKQNWMSLIRYLDREFLTPAVVFSFSKKKCEEIAEMLRSLDLNTAKERNAVQSFALQTSSRLSKNDSKLPQVLMICEMASRGIGVHHGGLLPILKEMVEILFSRNLIKVLFATETFAMGVNMPCKTVVFNSLRKHDGAQFRNLEPGEYTQMAGRAGRRGLDTVGTVIICCFGEQPIPQPILRGILTGKSTTLRSQFRLTYNMILNLLRVEEMSVESMIKRSFSEFATQRALTANEFPRLLSRGQKTLEKINQQLHDEAGNRVGAEDLEDYFRVSKELLGLNGEILSFLRETEPAYYDDVLIPGRVLLVSAARQYSVVRAPAIVLRAKPQQINSGALRDLTVSGSSTVVCIVLLPQSYVLESMSKTAGTIGFVGTSRQRHFALFEFELKQILFVSKWKCKVDPKALLSCDDANTGPIVAKDSFSRISGSDDPFAGMKSLGRKNDSGPGLGKIAGKDDRILDDTIDYLLKVEKAELRDMDLPLLEISNYVKRGADVVRYRQLCDRIGDLVVLMRSFSTHRHPSLEHWYTKIERRDILLERVATLQHLLSNESLQLFPDYLQRKAVLRKLGYVEANETVCIKGRVACEVNTCEELIATEMVFEGVLNDLLPEEIAAVLSSLVYQEKKDEELDSELPVRLVDCCERMKTIAINLGILQKEKGLDVDPIEYCAKSLNFGLVHVVYEWALGIPFKNICDLTDVQEGSIVRCITRLDELCREIRNCARVVGNPTLYRKLEAASVCIKRDIVFASSLYVS